MGTTFSVVYSSNQDLSKEITKLLSDINQEVSTYLPDSDISIFNESEGEYEVKITSDHFYNIWLKSIEVYHATDGFFDPTVMGIINYWGFGYKEKKARLSVDSQMVDSLMKYVGLEKIRGQKRQLYKSVAGIELDFSGIAKGYAVDAISQMLNAKEVKNYLIEIGGEVYCKGVNDNGEKWRLGINSPRKDAALTDIEFIVELSEKGMASSGNYRNFYIVQGKQYGHTINPHTGYPGKNKLVGVTVLAEDCMTADAYATAYMAMGLSKAMISVNNIDSLEACFFVCEDGRIINKKYSNGFVQHITRQ